MKGASLFSPIAKRLEGKVAVITGGASGIGQSAARLFAKNGAKVVIADVQDELGLSVCRDIGSSDTVSYVHCDVSNELDVKNAVDTAVEKYGKLDVMYNNAAIAGKYDMTILDADYDNFNRVFGVNVYGSFLAAKHAARVMIPANRGSILFTSSLASVTYGDVPYTYLTSKNAVVGLTKNLGVELGQYGIRVNCVSPFGVATPMLRAAFGGIEAEKVEEIVSDAGNLKGSMLKAEDIAQAALFLASDESKYVSGINLVVDGGYSTTNAALGITLEKYST